jgi:TolB-like protein/Flp pilus assembly protein TadD
MPYVPIRYCVVINLGAAQFDEEAQLLWDESGNTIALRAQCIRVLNSLIQARGALLRKEDLIKEVWGKTIVSDDSLVQCVKEIRQALEDHDHSILQTVHRRGYRLNFNRNSSVPIASASSLPISPKTVPLALAVMPFTSLEGDEPSERFAKSFTIALMNKLALHTELPLISRQATFALQGQVLSASVLSEKLQARYVVTGQVHLTESTKHWSLEMMESETQRVVWAESQQANVGEILLDQDALLKRIAATIQSYFLASKHHRALADAAGPEEPYNQFARIMETMFRSTPESAVEAQRMSALFLTEQAHYARAWIAHANTLLWDMHYCYTGSWTDKRVGEVLAKLNKAIELDRAYSLSYSMLAQALCCNGQFEEAKVALRKARDLEPSDSVHLNHHAHVHFFSGRLEDSLRCAAESIALKSTRLGHGLAHRGRCLVFSGQEAEGITDLTECVILIPGQNWARMALIVALEETGEHVKAGHHYAELLKYTRNFNRSFFGRHWSAIPEVRDRYIKALGNHGFS